MKIKFDLQPLSSWIIEESLVEKAIGVTMNRFVCG